MLGDENNIMLKVNPVAFAWLKNSIYALAIAGVYSIILVMLRTPQISHLFANKEMFKVALVVHVNLSILVWLLSMICLFWSYGTKMMMFDGAFPRIAFAGLILMAIGPFIGKAKPIMNNYVPMLENLSFIVGLTLFGVAILLYAAFTLFVSYHDFRARSSSVKLLATFKGTSSGLVILAWMMFCMSYNELDKTREYVPLDLDFYYELLFWSGGHLLQFIYTQGLMMALIVLFEAMRGSKLRLQSSYQVLFMLNFVLAIFAFYGHYAYEIIDGSFKEYFTKHMIYAGGIVPILFVITVTYDWCFLRAVNKRTILILPVVATIISSLLLFLSGGLIGAAISGVNVTIPAHYHGSIIGISVAFMGIAYLYCFREEICMNSPEKNGFLNILLATGYSTHANKDRKFVQPKRVGAPAMWQVGIFTFGQILHISGLALAGGYGVLRKSPDGVLPLKAKIYMGMMGGGGGLAIIGGLMFVYICVKKLRSL